MTTSSSNTISKQLLQHPLASDPDYANFFKQVIAFPRRRPAITTIDTNDTVVVCRKEILSEAVAYYTAKYSTLPVFYTFAPDNELRAACPDAPCNVRLEKRNSSRSTGSVGHPHTRLINLFVDYDAASVNPIDAIRNLFHGGLMGD